MPSAGKQPTLHGCERRSSKLDTLASVLPFGRHDELAKLFTDNEASA
ncbi:hypothetical protein DFI02_1311 [Rhizobium sp. PP-F2F-G20b]|nr:hypothetical protein DFI02_1311 [Rhizobium sp. PP-F2F-G20b]TCQ01592.1 hypothetical protein C8J34_12920 [Rhizobium sp. PP-F2F-G36]